MSPTTRPSEQLQRDPAEDAPPPAQDQEAVPPPPDREAGREPVQEQEAVPPPPDREAGTAADTEPSGASATEAGATGGERTGRRGTTWRGRLAGAVAAMVFAATATTAVLQWTAADRLEREKSEREAVSTRAGEFAVALQTYDHTDLQAYRDRVFAISGEDFEKTYNEAFSPLEGVITTMRANSSASIRGVYVSDVAEGRAKAITVVDSQVTSTVGTRRMLGTYMELSLIKTGGRWKVNAATVMGAAEELVTDPDGDPVEPSPTPSPTRKGD